MNTWCMLCFGAHHSRLKPPTIPATILPYFIKRGCLLWAIECPTQPTTIWVKPKRIMLIKAYSVVHAIKKVARRVTERAISHSHNGSKRCSTFLNIFSYYWESFEGCPVETMGKDLRIFSACSEWRHLSLKQNIT